MIVRLKDHTGATVVLNTDNLLFVAQAADAQSKSPILGMSVAIMMGGHSLQLKGTPEEIYGALRKFESPHQLPNGTVVAG